MICFLCARASRPFRSPQTLVARSLCASPDASPSPKVSYLISSCGLSPAAAQSVAEKLVGKTVERIASVVALLRSYGFAKAQIAKLAEKHPTVFCSKAGILKPKLDFFQGLRLSGSDIGKLFSSEPRILETSLVNRIAPNFDSLKALFGGEEQATAIACQVPRVLMHDINNNMVHNVEALRRHRMPETGIRRLVFIKPRALFIKPDRFEEFVVQLEELGYDFSTEAPVRPLSVLAGMSSSTWERKLALLKSLGWSEEEILSAFRRNPFFLGVAEEKIKQRADFLMYTLNWSPAAIAAHPVLLMCSLERRVIPRCSVYNLLVSKRILSKKMPEIHLFTMGEERFLESYVKKYQDIVPEVLDASQGKLELAGLEMECNRKPNIETLRRYGMSQSSIRKIARERPKALLVSSQHFKAVVKGLKRMDYDFSSKTFPEALSVLATMPDIVSEGKFTLYRRLGWTNDDFVAAFKKQPGFVMVPDEKVRRMFDFFKNKLNWGPTDIANSPSLLLLSLENNIIPRYSVFKILVSNGLIRNKMPVVSLFTKDESTFSKEYVNKYQEKVPGLIEVYNSRIEFVD